MKIIFRTNIDHYKTNCFPENLQIPPRIGDTVVVNEVFIDYYAKRKLPIGLVVIDVAWSEKGVVCELWYKHSDIEAAKLTGVKLF